MVRWASAQLTFRLNRLFRCRNKTSSMRLSELCVTARHSSSYCYFVESLSLEEWEMLNTVTRLRFTRPLPPLPLKFLPCPLIP